MDLACLKGFVDAKSFCNCKQHDVRVRFVCLEPSCSEKMTSICLLCLKSNHKNHENIEITNLYHILINEMAGEEQNLNLNKEKLLQKDKELSNQMKQMDTLLFDIEILFKTVKQLYKDTKSAIDGMKDLIKETPTPSHPQLGSTGRKVLKKDQILDQRIFSIMLHRVIANYKLKKAHQN